MQAWRRGLDFVWGMRVVPCRNARHRAPGPQLRSEHPSETRPGYATCAVVTADAKGGAVVPGRGVLMLALYVGARMAPWACKGAPACRRGIEPARMPQLHKQRMRFDIWWGAAASDPAAARCGGACGLAVGCTPMPLPRPRAPDPRLWREHRWMLRAYRFEADG